MFVAACIGVLCSSVWFFEAGAGFEVLIISAIYVSRRTPLVDNSLLLAWAGEAASSSSTPGSLASPFAEIGCVLCPRGKRKKAKIRCERSLCPTP